MLINKSRCLYLQRLLILALERTVEQKHQNGFILSAFFQTGKA